MIPIINQYGKEYLEVPEKIRIACRAIIIDGDKILLSHELYTQVYLTVGGGLEKGETHEECCVREVLEESGYIIKTGKQFCTVNEYYKNMLYTSHYFICEITGKGERNLTKAEIEHGVTPEWVELSDALKIFGEYEKYAETDEEIEGQYKREFAVLTRFKDEVLN